VLSLLSSPPTSRAALLASAITLGACAVGAPPVRHPCNLGQPPPAQWWPPRAFTCSVAPLPPTARATCTSCAGRGPRTTTLSCKAATPVPPQTLPLPPLLPPATPPQSPHCCPSECPQVSQSHRRGIGIHHRVHPDRPQPGSGELRHLARPAPAACSRPASAILPACSPATQLPPPTN
jgi:hypothetical protein